MLHTMQLMPIGRFSRLTGVGVKALRHYDEVGLLAPAAVDDETGYRFYSADQVDRAEAIRLLRRLDMPLEEIRSTLAAGDPATLRAALVSHQRQIATRDAELRASRVRLQRLIDGRETIMGMRSESLRGRGAPSARHRPLQPHLDADGLARRRDAPLRTCVRLPLDAGGRDHGEPRAQRVAVLARLLDPRPARARAPARAPLPRARRVLAGGDGGLGPRRRARGARAGPSRRRRDGGGAPQLRARRARILRRSRTPRTGSTSRRISTRFPFEQARSRPRRMVETSRSSGCEGRRHSNGRIRARCQLDRRPAPGRRRERWMRRARAARRARHHFPRKHANALRTRELAERRAGQARRETLLPPDASRRAEARSATRRRTGRSPLAAGVRP